MVAPGDEHRYISGVPQYRNQNLVIGLRYPGALAEITTQGQEVRVDDIYLLQHHRECEIVVFLEPGIAVGVGKMGELETLVVVIHHFDRLVFRPGSAGICHHQVPQLLRRVRGYRGGQLPPRPGVIPNICRTV